MKKLLIFLIIILILILTLKLNNKNNPHFLILKKEYFSDLTIFESFCKIVGIVPTSFKNRFIVKEIECSQYIQQFMHDSLCNRSYCYINFMKTKNKGFLYAPPHFRLRTIKEINVEDRSYIHKIIDNKLFAELVGINHLKQEETVTLYLDYLKEAFNKFTIVIEIKTLEDIDIIINRYKPIFEYTEFTFDKKNLQIKENKSSKYFWVSSFGVIEIILDSNEVLIIKDLGLIGNEYIVM